MIPNSRSSATRGYTNKSKRSTGASVNVRGESVTRVPRNDASNISERDRSKQLILAVHSRLNHDNPEHKVDHSNQKSGYIGLDKHRDSSDQNHCLHQQQQHQSSSRFVTHLFTLKIKMIKKFIIFIFVILTATHVSTDWLNYGLCRFRECCHENDGTGYIKYEKGCDQLLEALKTKVYGQPLIVSPIYKSVKAHMSNDRPSRPLVMYFSGWTGTGKTYVAKLIANNIYKEGMNSRFVKYISSSLHFPIKIETDVEIAIHRQRLRDMIRKVVSDCDRSLIILDELDKLPSGVVDALQPMLDYIEDVDGVRYNKAIFIFLSNTGAEKLNVLSYKMFKEGKERKDLSSKDIEEILINESFSEQGGLRHSSLLRRYSIGVFVPFLPLERQHVKFCIKDEIENSHVIPDNIDELVEEIADEMTYFPEESQIYSKSGCKGVHDKVVNNIGPQIYSEPQKLQKKENLIWTSKSDL